MPSALFFFLQHPLALYHIFWRFAPYFIQRLCVSNDFICFDLFLFILPLIPNLYQFCDYLHLNSPPPPTRHPIPSFACASVITLPFDTMVFLRLSIKVFPREQLAPSSSSGWSLLGGRKSNTDDSSQGSAASTVLKKPGVFLLVLEHPEEVSLGGLAGMIQEHWAKLHPELE